MAEEKEIKLQKEECPEIYSNFLQVANTFGEFSLIFGQSSPKNTSEAKPQIRVIVNPYMALQIIKVLNVQIKKYKKMWGEIKHPPKEKK